MRCVRHYICSVIHRQRFYEFLKGAIQLLQKIHAYMQYIHAIQYIHTIDILN